MSADTVCSSPLPLIAVTTGEPAGIGPDLCVLLAQRAVAARLIVVGDPELLAQRARLLGLPWRGVALSAVMPEIPRAAGAIAVLPVPVAAPVVPGKLDPANARHVLRTLDAAVEGCMEGRFDAMVTLPAHKGILNDAGIAFTGHTEYLAARTGAPHVVMMLVDDGLRVALATTHLAVRDIARHITRDDLEQTLRVLHHDLGIRFGIATPRIAVAGLNPHAGEGGHLGREEIEIIAPLIARLRDEGWRISGPLPADTLFQRERLAGFDCALAMYHDQGLPVFKHASFGRGVNVTLGLPIIRTSVDHGTALELAATGKAEPGSLYAAVDLAVTLARRARDSDASAAQTVRPEFSGR
ncbi:MAG TPA: 4-hydroxythreonine-4-phosphate dehydrogenase PdxA [Burkholderiales bacterium]|nr:4-hydroxythreonine-4-phosphate dehydrogenase PdxA [Burkholderiales bacterium]